MDEACGRGLEWTKAGVDEAEGQSLGFMSVLYDDPLGELKALQREAIHTR